MADLRTRVTADLYIGNLISGKFGRVIVKTWLSYAYTAELMNIDWLSY